MLSGRGILVKGPDPIVLRRFFLLVTKFVRCRDDIMFLDDLHVLIQAELRQDWAEIL